MEKEILKSKTGYSCPKCDHPCFDDQMISKGEPELKHTNDGDPYAEWEEIFRCNICGTVYSLMNGF